MKRNKAVPAVVLAMLYWVCAASGQGMPTALQKMQLSAFGAVSGVFTGLDDYQTGKTQGTNVSLTAGGDLGLMAHHGIRPTIEIRGTYPIDKGTVDAQKSIEGGLRFDFWLGRRVRPYVVGLFGRGSTDYPNGYLYNNFQYDLTTNYVYGGGGGIDYMLTDHLGLKLDGQIQHWTAAPTASGIIYPAQANLGVVYLIDFNHHRHR